MKKIYVCSPYRGNIEENVAAARKFCRYVLEQGYLPIAPHLYFPQFISEETERDLAFKLNLELLSVCDELWVFGPKITSGMQFEINHAHTVKRISLWEVEEYLKGTS